VYETVRLANARGHAVAGPSVTPHDIDDAVTGVLEASPFAAFIRTKTGHGLGREVHEAPYIMRGNHQSLAPQMVLTNEPGLYLDGELGVRIEDDVVITPTGSRSLTSFARELTVIG
jgi:Xaa-Pro dipeptidase